MNQIVTCILLLLSLFGTFSKYVYIKKHKSWNEAQSFCRKHHTDLASVSNEQDNLKLGKLGNSNDHIWIGLKNSSESKKWMWSGGTEVSSFFWASDQPDNQPEQIYGVIHNNKWHDYPDDHLHFFCYSAEVVREEKTWEEALEYCRKHHNNLASVASETEMMLIQKELKKHITTEHIWIGLHFLAGNWLWVDGQEMGYKAWSEGRKPSCPHGKMECAAVQVTRSNNVWEARDCEERLSFICYWA